MDVGKPEITPERMAAYQATARRRQQEELRHQRGWAIARAGAQMLFEQFGAQRIVLFGSLLEIPS